MKTLQIWKIFSILLFVICIKAQVEESKISYASLKDMETFIKTLSAVEENLTSYIDRQNKRIEELKRYFIINIFPKILKLEKNSHIIN